MKNEDEDDIEYFVPIEDNVRRQAEKGDNISRVVLEVFTEMVQQIGEWGVNSKIKPCDLMTKLKDRCSQQDEEEELLKYLVAFLNLLGVNHTSTYLGSKKQAGANQYKSKQMNIQSSKIAMLLAHSRGAIDLLVAEITHILNSFSILTKITGLSESLKNIISSKEQRETNDMLTIVLGKKSLETYQNYSPTTKDQEIECSPQTFQLYQSGHFELIYRLPMYLVSKLEDYIHHVKKEHLTKFISVGLGLTPFVYAHDGTVTHLGIKRSITKLLHHMNVHRLTAGMKLTLTEGKLYLIYQGTLLLSCRSGKNLQKCKKHKQNNNENINEMVLGLYGLILTPKNNDNDNDNDNLSLTNNQDQIIVSHFDSQHEHKTLLLQLDWKHVQSAFQSEQAFFWEKVLAKVQAVNTSRQCLWQQNVLAAKEQEPKSSVESLGKLKETHFVNILRSNKNYQSKPKKYQINTARCHTQGYSHPQPHKTNINQFTTREALKSKSPSQKQFVEYESNQLSSAQNDNILDLRNYSKFISNFPFVKILESHEKIQNVKNKYSPSPIPEKVFSPPKAKNRMRSPLSNVKKISTTGQNKSLHNHKLFSRFTFKHKQGTYSEKTDNFRNQLNRSRRLKIKNIAERTISNGTRRAFDIEGVEKILNQNSLFPIDTENIDIKPNFQEKFGITHRNFCENQKVNKILEKTKNHKVKKGETLTQSIEQQNWKFYQKNKKKFTKFGGAANSVCLKIQKNKKHKQHMRKSKQKIETKQKRKQDSLSVCQN